MQFRTQIPISKSNNPIDYTSGVVSLGSCFAVNMAERLDYFKFKNTVNPFGILFHPLAIEQLIGFAVNGKQFIEKDTFFHNERWHCFDAHSGLSNPDQQQLVANLNSITAATNQHLKKATHIIITFGTAWVYRNLESETVVANCHKVPQKKFAKDLLSVETITGSIQNTIALLKKSNPSVTIIFTVSPVRHIKDGFVQNQCSKSNLIAALHNAIKNTSATYFPSYEIMMDELRDYRFYAEDMLHPNQTAIDYIWERFSETHISATAIPLLQEIGSIQKALSHRPFDPDSAQHQQFSAKILLRILAVQTQYPHITF